MRASRVGSVLRRVLPKSDVRTAGTNGFKASTPADPADEESASGLGSLAMSVKSLQRFRSSGHLTALASLQIRHLDFHFGCSRLVAATSFGPTTLHTCVPCGIMSLLRSGSEPVSIGLCLLAYPSGCRLIRTEMPSSPA